MKNAIKTSMWGALSLALVTVTASDAAAQARSYELIRVDSGVSGTYASSFGRGGFGAVVEPKLMVHDQIAAGLRLEGAVMFGGSIDTGSDDVSMDMAAVAAVMAKGEYFLTTGGARPFVSLGFGMFDIGSQSVDAGGSGNANVNQKAGRYFGAAPSLGVDLGRVRLAATYNMILGADVEVTQTVGNVEQTASFSQSYLTFELSFRWGGNRKPAPPPALAATPVARAR